jgi:hypothetical protein
MRKRLQVGMKLLLKENPFLPTSFKFDGICLLEKYKREEKIYIEKTYIEMGLNTVESVENEFTSPEKSPIKIKNAETLK